MASVGAGGAWCAAAVSAQDQDGEQEAADHRFLSVNM
jgi:hypothetical protein